ncbi:MAG: hypothetical protein A2W25_06360 [candidate division Zixibacteria bacterium RBG_16_53_22]|nr:MAG: hypothetical protein A2W25_06360 [candidate division Zixibacteria bacterium RBG_16_53_22]
MIRHALIFLTLLCPLSVVGSDVPLSWNDATTLFMEKEIPTISPGLALSLSQIPIESTIPVIVFFTDKGISGQVQYINALNLAQSTLSPSTLDRRLKSRGKENILDFRDLPLSRSHIDAVLSTGAELRHELKWFNAISVYATGGQLAAIAAFPFVRYIKPVSYARMGAELPTEPIIPDANLISLNYGQSQAQLEQINVISAHELGFKGQGVIVCMMDTGYRQGHDAFQAIISGGRLIAQYDFINHDNNTDYDPSQDLGGQPDHGTMTWSTLGGEASGFLYGPSYLAHFVLAKTEDISSERHIEEDNWAAGAQWADSIGASVISASLGYRWFDSGQGDYDYSQIDGNSTIVTIAADLAAYNGIAVATAMGNEGNISGSIVAPADGDSVIACGAVDSQGILAGFSSWGPTYDGRIKPEVCARGVGTTCVSPYDIHGYYTASGTSLSTPLVGGACGVLFSAHPNWTPMMVREALMATADRFDAPDNAYGSGILDVGRAIYSHPAGDIIIDHRPIIFATPNDPLIINTAVTGELDSVFLYYRAGEVGDFVRLAMISVDSFNFTSQIPGELGGTIYYFIKAVRNGETHAFWPLGGQMHPYTVSPGASSFADSFEDGLGYWKTGGTFAFWGLTALYSSTGNLSVADSPNTQYRDNTDSFLESLFDLDLSHAAAANLRFQVRGTLPAGGDSLHVEGSPDSINWIRLGPPITGSMPAFVERSFDLAALVGQSDARLRFRLDSDGSSQEDGIYIDDVSIELSMAPHMSFYPASIIDTLLQGEIESHDFVVKNSGQAPLFVSLSAIESSPALNTWLFVSPSADTIAPGDSLVGQITLDATSVPDSIYNGHIQINSNDPGTPSAPMPVSLVVRESFGCLYIPGDINGSGAPNGIDVTYGVTYLKGGNAPRDSCDCPPMAFPFYAAGDVNGNCAFNGIDIVYFVTYLKGQQAALLYCQDCPPAP